MTRNVADRPRSSASLFAFVDRLFEEVDACDLAAQPDEEEGVLPGAASSVQDRPGDLVGQVDKFFPWPADVPRRLTSVDGLEGGTVGYGHGCSPVILLRLFRHASRQYRTAPGIEITDKLGVAA